MACCEASARLQTRSPDAVRTVVSTLACLQSLPTATTWSTSFASGAVNATSRTIGSMHKATDLSGTAGVSAGAVSLSHPASNNPTANAGTRPTHLKANADFMQPSRESGLAWPAMENAPTPTLDL